MYIPQNHVRQAVSRIGGPTKAAHAMGVSNTTIHQWIRDNRISDIDKAKAMSQLSGIKLESLRSTL